MYFSIKLTTNVLYSRGPQSLVRGLVLVRRSFSTGPQWDIKFKRCFILKLKIDLPWRNDSTYIMMITPPSSPRAVTVDQTDPHSETKRKYAQHWVNNPTAEH